MEKKLKHIKLFEQMGSATPLIVAKGDWSGILLDPTPENISSYASGILPSTFMVTYHTNPSQSEMPSGGSSSDYYDLEDIVMEITSGDQNGTNISPKFFRKTSFDPQTTKDIEEGILRIPVDPSISPDEIESALRDAMNGMEEEFLEETEVNPEAFTPKFLNYARKIESGEPAYFKRKLVFKVN
jgi:hypothetical protein